MIFLTKNLLTSIYLLYLYLLLYIWNTNSIWCIYLFILFLHNHTYLQVYSLYKAMKRVTPDFDRVFTVLLGPQNKRTFFPALTLHCSDDQSGIDSSSLTLQVIHFTSGPTLLHTLFLILVYNIVYST